VTTLYKSLSHTDWCSQSRFSLRCLVAASNGERSSSLGFASSHGSVHLTPNSYSSDCRLRTLSLSANSSWSALYSLCTGPTKKTLPTVLLSLHDVAIGTDRVENTVSQLPHCCFLRSCCVGRGMFAEPFPSSGCLCWLHTSCREQYAIVMFSALSEMWESNLCTLNGFLYFVAASFRFLIFIVSSHHFRLLTKSHVMVNLRNWAGCVLTPGLISCFVDNPCSVVWAIPSFSDGFSRQKNTCAQRYVNTYPSLLWIIESSGIYQPASFSSVNCISSSIIWKLSVRLWSVKLRLSSIFFERCLLPANSYWLLI
jgi:hypothetical protein